MNLIALAFVALAVSTQAWPQDAKGVITVKVVDQQGNPMRDAIVTLDPPPGRALIYASPRCKTDASGSCTRGSLELDTYLVRVNKPTAGYPDMSFSFYSHQSKKIVVTLSPEHTDSNVVFTLGPKAAMLKLNVVDDSTGAPIDNPTIILRTSSDRNDWISIGRTADSIVLVPPDTNVEIETSADKYLDWRWAEHPEVAGNRVSAA